MATPHVPLATMVAAHCRRYGWGFCAFEFLVLTVIGVYLAVTGASGHGLPATLLLVFGISLAVNSVTIALLVLVSGSGAVALAPQPDKPYTAQLTLLYVLPFAAVGRYLYDMTRRTNRQG